MDLTVTLAVAEDAPCLSSLFQLYAYDFSDLLGLDVDEHGRFRPPAYGGIGQDPRRRAFLFRVSGQLAGFALVHEGSVLTGDPHVRDMGEFFVLRRYRRAGVGEAAARALFDRFPGRWEVRERAENTAATAFWRRVIGRYAAASLDEVVWNDEHWRGPVQRFAAGPSAP